MKKVSDLVVWLDTKLTFVAHLDLTAVKANRALGVLIRSLQTMPNGGTTLTFLTTGPILAAYFGNVRSVLEYGYAVWGGAAPAHINRLEKLNTSFYPGWRAAFNNHAFPTLHRAMIY